MEKKILKIAFYKHNLEGILMTTPVAPLVLSIIEELEEKSLQMNSQDFDMVSSLVNYHDLTSYDLDYEARTCSYR